MKRLLFLFITLIMLFTSCSAPLIIEPSFPDTNADELFSQLDAVRDGKVIIVESIYFERPTARITKLIGYITDSIEAFEKNNEEASSDAEAESEEQDNEATEGSEEEDYYEEGYDDEYYE